jgi:hypothetical protein
VYSFEPQSAAGQSKFQIEINIDAAAQGSADDANCQQSFDSLRVCQLLARNSADARI